MKRYLSMLLILMWLLSMAAPVYADGIIGEMETEVEIRGLTEFNVRMLVSRYFTQRKAFLQGTAETIDVVVPAMVTDEAAHKDAIADVGADLIDSVVVIESLSLGDYTADVVVAETVDYLLAGENKQEEISHKITVFMRDDSTLIVHADAYRDVYSDFRSASYISPEQAVTNTTGGGTLCIISKAQSQLGYTEGANNYNKYGLWYNGYKNTTGFEYQVWCAMFVCWCSYHVGIPTTVIPIYASAPYMRDFYVDKGLYELSHASQGNYLPEPGDLIFMYNTDELPGHIGIVTGYSGGVVTFIDGNNNTSVAQWTAMYTDTRIVAYATPRYERYSHDMETTWSYTGSYHWKACEKCDHQQSRAQHTIVWSSNAIHHTKACTVCNYSATESHIFIEDDMGNFVCPTCGYEAEDGMIINSMATDCTEGESE